MAEFSLRWQLCHLNTRTGDAAFVVGVHVDNQSVREALRDAVYKRTMLENLNRSNKSSRCALCDMGFLRNMIPVCWHMFQKLQALGFADSALPECAGHKNNQAGSLLKF